MKLDLKNVTLCIVDTLNHALAVEAINRSTEDIQFGDVILMTNIRLEGNFRVCQIPELKNIDDYNRIILSELYSATTTDFVLVAQWDGFVVNSGAWNDAFYNYDYIGARWANQGTGRDIGNGGFSFRSRRLLSVVASAAHSRPNGMAEDLFIGHHLRQVLESEHDIKFASSEIADIFSYEHGNPRNSPFGFHAIYNLWRHLPYRKLVEIIKEIPVVSINNPSTALLLVRLLQSGQVAAFSGIFQLLLARIGAQALLSNYIRATGNPERSIKEFQLGLTLNNIHNIEISQ